MIVRALQILWPSFLVAGVLEMLVFAVIDPSELHWFGGARIEWSAKSVYAFTFLMFWGAIASAGAVTAFLTAGADKKAHDPAHDPAHERR